MTRNVAVLILLCLALLAWIVFAQPGPAVPPKPDTVVVQRSAKAETVSVRTLRTVRDTRVVLDSIFRVDTLRDTVVRVVVESLLVACERCGRELAEFRRFADSVRVSDRDSIVKLNRALAHERSRRKFWAAGGYLLREGLAHLTP